MKRPVLAIGVLANDASRDDGHWSIHRIFDVIGGPTAPWGFPHKVVVRMLWFEGGPERTAADLRLVGPSGELFTAKLEGRRVAAGLGGPSAATFVFDMSYGFSETGQYEWVVSESGVEVGRIPFTVIQTAQATPSIN